MNNAISQTAFLPPPISWRRKMSTITQKSIMKYVIKKKITKNDQRISPSVLVNRTINGLLVGSVPVLAWRTGA